MVSATLRFMEHVKLASGSKQPVSGETWTVSSDAKVIREWIRQKFNIGLIMGIPNNVTVVDIDEKERARKFFAQWRTILKTVVETRRGAHFFFKGAGPSRKTTEFDLKRDGGYVVFPPSVVDGWTYRYVPGFEWSDDLPEFPQELEPPEREVKTVLTEVDCLRKIQRAQAYGLTVTCTEGAKAHDTLWRFVCWMRDLGLTQTEAYAVLLPWNHTNCFDRSGKPYPWSIRELTHKLEDAFSKVKGA